jgi:acetyl esterase/lipase
LNVFSVVLIPPALVFLTSCSSLFKGSSFTVQKDIVFKSHEGTELKADAFIPKTKGLKPAVIVIHGGGWARRSGDMESICKDLARQGFVAFNITYRLAPQNLFPKSMEDAKDSILWLRENSARFEIDPEQIGGWGYSAGAHLILLAGLDPAMGLKAIVSGGTPADLTAWPNSPMVEDFLGSKQKDNPELWKNASPIFHVQKKSPPVFLYHGEWDKIVEIGQMDKMQQALEQKQVPVQTLRLSWMGHVATYYFSQKAVDQGIDFLKSKMTNHSAR